MMLESGGNDVLFVLSGTEAGSGNNGLVVGLAAAGGEDDLPGLAAQAIGHGPAGFSRASLAS